MLKWIIVIGLVIICAIFPFVRCVVTHPHLVAKYGSVDLYHYFKYKMWNNIPDGQVVGMLRIYTGLFGKGKTLSMVKNMCWIYDRYNNLKIYDVKRGEWVTQRVLLLSNVDINRPMIKLESLSQITNLAHSLYEKDLEEGTYTAIICGIDELSTMLNSRSFKDNIDPMFLNTLLTCRKYHLAIYGTAQRFQQCDALLRQVTQQVVECNKIWRLQGQKVYDGFELENGINPTLVEPMLKKCVFITNKDYANYNTLAMVDNLRKKYDENDFISEEEILNTISSDMVGADTVTKYSKKASKRKPHKKKYA